jgi:hypothetical protein
VYSWAEMALNQFSTLTDAVSKLKINYTTHPNLTATDINNLTIALNSVINLVNTFPYPDFGLNPAFLNSTVYADILNGIKALNDISGDLVDSNYGLALNDALNVLNPYVKDSTTLSIISKYGNFAVSVIKAKSNSDMLAALDAAALPVGSYRIKRNSYGNISLNAYVGPFAGAEWYPNPKSVPNNVKQWALNTGFTAPVGIAFSWGGRHSSSFNYKLKGNSNTIFISVLDVGAVTAFRLTNDSAATLPSFKLQNVVAPGAYFIYGCPKLPLSIGAGGQYGPQLRSLSDGATVLPSAISFRIFAAIDIPFFDFYTRTEKKN